MVMVRRNEEVTLFKLGNRKKNELTGGKSFLGLIRTIINNFKHERFIRVNQLRLNLFFSYCLRRVSADTSNLWTIRRTFFFRDLCFNRLPCIWKVEGKTNCMMFINYKYSLFTVNVSHDSNHMVQCILFLKCSHMKRKKRG